MNLFGDVLIIQCAILQSLIKICADCEKVFKALGSKQNSNQD